MTTVSINSLFGLGLLPRVVGHPPSVPRKPSEWARLSRHYEELTLEVRNHWSELDVEKKQGLRDFAESMIVRDDIHSANEFRFVIARLGYAFKFLWIIVSSFVSGNFGDFLQACISGFALASAVWEAIEDEEAPIMERYLDLLCRDSSDDLVTYTEEDFAEASALVSDVSFE